MAETRSPSDRYNETLLSRGTKESEGEGKKTGEEGGEIEIERAGERRKENKGRRRRALLSRERHAWSSYLDELAWRRWGWCTACGTKNRKKYRYYLTPGLWGRCRDSKSERSRIDRYLSSPRCLFRRCGGSIEKKHEKHLFSTLTAFLSSEKKNRFRSNVG